MTQLTTRSTRTLRQTPRACCLHPTVFAVVGRHLEFVVDEKIAIFSRSSINRQANPRFLDLRSNLMTPNHCTQPTDSHQFCIRKLAACLVGRSTPLLGSVTFTAVALSTAEQ